MHENELKRNKVQQKPKQNVVLTTIALITNLVETFQVLTEDSMRNYCAIDQMPVSPSSPAFHGPLCLLM